MTPTEHEWPDEEPTSEEDVVKRAMKRLDRLSKGICGDLWKMHQNCHKEVYENGNMEHMPMTFVRYQEGEDESTRELFYICRKCISDYLMKHPEAIDKVVILRGEPTKECREFIQRRMEQRFREEQAKELQREEKMKEVLQSDRPCPICGKPFNRHSEDDFKKCLKDYVQANPPDEEGTYNKP